MTNCINYRSAPPAAQFLRNAPADGAPLQRLTLNKKYRPEASHSEAVCIILLCKVNQLDRIELIAPLNELRKLSRNYLRPANRVALDIKRHKRFVKR